MNIQLKKVENHELDEVHSLQIAAFESLLIKYQDYESNPGAETLIKIKDGMDIIFYQKYKN